MGFGGRVREIRQQLGLSLKDLADRAGLDKGYLSQIETEKRPNPSVHLARRIADALKVDLGALMDGIEGGTTAEGVVFLPPALAAYVAMREEQGRPLGWAWSRTCAASSSAASTRASRNNTRSW